LTLGLRGSIPLGSTSLAIFNYELIAIIDKTELIDNVIGVAIINNMILQKLYNLIFPSFLPTAEICRKYHIPEAIKLHIRITDNGWLVATSPDLLGLITQAHNVKKLLVMVNDAILTYFDVPKQEANIVFPHINLEGQGSLSYKHKLQPQFAS